MRVGIPKETAPGEQRVAMVPDVVKRLSKKNSEVVVESGAGDAASVLDDALKEAGATIAASPDEVWQADVVAKVRAPSPDEIGKLKQGGVLVGFLAPLTDPDTATALAKAGVTAFAME